ncbi:MAG TPA: ATP-binding protein [Pyrinomonadaceae bacterium]
MSSSAQLERTEALTIDAVAHCTEFASAQARQAGFPAARVDEIELVVEEVVANICHYSYGDRLGNVELVCRLTSGPTLELEFTDGGRPFDMLTLPEPNLAVDIDQRGLGGVGVPMMRALVDQASYRREGERNILCLIFHSACRLGGTSQVA